MIEQLPEIQRLSESQKIELATELWDELNRTPVVEPDPAIVHFLEQRYAEFKAGGHPSSSWEEVKRRIGK